ncbi:MAG: hypothetical protein RLZZ54_632 [Cyanobacteriota bacterium]
MLPAVLKPVLPRLSQALRMAERFGERCGAPVLMAGLIVGIGVVELGCGPLGQTSRFSLELLILLVLQLVGPGVVALIAMALLMPRWLEACQHLERRHDPSAAASGLVGAVLLLLFLTAALIGGVLASPRADLVAEFTDVMSGVLLPDLLRATLRSAVFLAVLCSWCQWQGRRLLKRGLSATLVSSDLMIEGLMLLLGLKLVWVLAIDPLRVSLSAQ